MKIEKTELANKIGRIKSILPKNTPIEALKSVLVRDGYLIASDMEITVTVKLEGISEGTEESFLIPESMIGFINALPSGEVEISAKAENEGTVELEVKAGKVKNNILTLSVTNYPAIKSTEAAKELGKVEAEDLKAGITHTLFAVAENNAKSVMNALNMKCANGELALSGLDGYMLATDKIPLEGEFDLNIPKRTCQQLLNLDIEGLVTILTDGKTVIFETAFSKIESRLIEGDYYQIERMLSDLPITVSMKRKSFVEALSRTLLLIGSNDSKAVSIDFSGEKAEVTLKNGRNAYVEDIGLNEDMADGEKILFAVNPKMLLTALKAFDSENVYLNLANEKRPMKILTDESDQKALVLPVRISKA